MVAVVFCCTLCTTLSSLGVINRMPPTPQSITYTITYIIDIFIPIALPQISSLKLALGTNSPLSLNCTSTGSPALTVVWTKDGIVLPNTSSYTTTQALRNGTTASYDNLLDITGQYSELVGLYSCIVHDSLGHNSVPASLQVNGI